jgi:hypothetical protein
VAYVCGEAAPAYAGLLNTWRRHVILLRPSVICILDDLEATKPSDYQWLMHSAHQLRLDEGGQLFTQQREGLVMTARMFSTIPMAFSQSNEWPVDPQTGFPEPLPNEPGKIWHFKAGSTRKARQFRMVTLMKVERPGEKTDARIEREGDEVIILDYKAPGAENTLKINLATDAANIVELTSKLREGSTQSLTKP